MANRLKLDGVGQMGCCGYSQMVTKPVAAGTQIDGFTATTRVSTMVQGQYTAQVTRQLPAIQGTAAEAPSAAAKASKQALIGALQTPSFLANVK
ncbi:MAG TPA: hypothetical protein VHT00_05940 [Stellaceae bacterium]|jgi:hypothetical protein|nr:hypothetical protein [Stellaceae bacterium]